jgi:glycosyltransferase involved in cell wall biosynthesis
LFADLLRSYGRNDLAKNIIVSPHPVTAEMVVNPAVAKEDLILAVGRWDAWQKDSPLLIKSLAVFLTKESGYHVEIIGNGLPTLKRLLVDVPDALRARIQVVGPVPHDQLHSYYQRARILFVSSRMESGPITAAEALCCGASVAGPASIPPLHYFTSEGSGTLAADRTATGLAAALQSEASAWRRGERDPRRLSELWIPRSHAPDVARHLMEVAARKS